MSFLRVGLKEIYQAQHKISKRILVVFGLDRFVCSESHQIFFRNIVRRMDKSIITCRQQRFYKMHVSRNPSSLPSLGRRSFDQ